MIESDAILAFLRDDVGAKLIAAPITVAIVSAMSYARSYLGNKFKWLFIGTLKRTALLLFAGNATAYLLAHYAIIDSTVALIISAAIGSWAALSTAFKFHQVGVLDAFKSTETGFSYASSVKQPTHSFDFLGVGAHKVTSEKEFAKMVERFGTSKRPIRFLLSPPENPLLRSIAARNVLDKNTYRDRVKASLKILAELSETRGFNIQVRFYRALGSSVFNQFRLVFIDDRYCVMSYTVWDSKEGRSNPQLILRSHGREPKSRSLYSTFKDYYDSLWEDEKTVAVDLKKYL